LFLVNLFQDGAGTLTELTPDKLRRDSPMGIPLEEMTDYQIKKAAQINEQLFTIPTN